MILLAMGHVSWPSSRLGLKVILRRVRHAAFGGLRHGHRATFGGGLHGTSSHPPFREIQISQGHKENKEVMRYSQNILIIISHTYQKSNVTSIHQLPTPLSECHLAAAYVWHSAHCCTLSHLDMSFIAHGHGIGSWKETNR